MRAWKVAAAQQALVRVMLVREEVGRVHDAAHLRLQLFPHHHRQYLCVCRRHRGASGTAKRDARYHAIRYISRLGLACDAASRILNMISGAGRAISGRSRQVPDRRRLCVGLVASKNCVK